MYKVTVTLTKTDTPLPGTVPFNHTALTVTDSAGTQQTFGLFGTEAPPWSQGVTVAADGVSNYSAQDMDENGAPIGTAVTTTFTPAAAATFPATSAITVTAA